jgi:pimeloyl-ACP methyl ester carboxylesterase
MAGIRKNYQPQSTIAYLCYIYTYKNITNFKKVLIISGCILSVLMTEQYTPLRSGLFWNFTLPSIVADPTLVVFISDWIYGLLPYCGPGKRHDAWDREKVFQNEICRFLNYSGIATLSLHSSEYDDNPPDENTLIELSSESELTSSLEQMIAESGCSFKRTVLFGHGFGTRLLCKLAASGLKPAGYILAAGLYSEIESILNQKYLPYGNYERKNILTDNNVLDPETALIIKNFSNILHTIRKGKERKRLIEEDVKLDLYFPPELFSLENSSEIILSHLNAPTLIIHGSGDLDIPVSNAFSLEQKLKQHIPSVSRIILLDCDHWFREMPDGSEERLKERLNGNCIHHKIDNRFFKNTQMFIQDVLKMSTEKIRSPTNIPDSNGMISSF